MGAATSSTGKSKSATIRRSTATCWASFCPKYARVIDVLRWQASGLGAEEEDVAFLELDVTQLLAFLADQPILLVFALIGVGMALGNIKLKGISLEGEKLSHVEFLENGWGQ